MYNQRIAARRFASATTSIPAGGADTLVTTGSVDFNNGMTTSTANTITVVVSGLYRLSGAVSWDTGTNNNRYTTSIRINGAVVAQGGFALGFSESNTPGGNVSIIKSLAAGDLITLGAGQTGSAANTVNSGTTVTWLEAELIARS
jgi:hypothetical protein